MNKARKKSIDAMFELYPRGRKLIYESFDKLGSELTRTQQMILLALSVQDGLSMSQLADKISTSNEQATRAVAQLVDKGYVTREQNKQNRRVVNISLTDKAVEHINAAKATVLDDTRSRAKALTDEDMDVLYESVTNLLGIFNKLEDQVAKKY
ncbi:MAG: MarR family transcriptional regulator [Ruminococcus sp.]|nr:MarR family transcriptional regulator [Ruminococcus sp.]